MRAFHSTILLVLVAIGHVTGAEQATSKGAAAAAQQKTPPAAAAAAAAQPNNPALAAAATKYQTDLQVTNQSWDQFRRNLDVERQASTIDAATYNVLLAKYQSGMASYQQGVQSRAALAARATTVAETGGRGRGAAAASQTATNETVAKLMLSQATLADANVALASAKHRKLANVDQLSNEAKADMLGAFTTRESAALKGYIQVHFPKPAAGQTFEAYSAQIGTFSGNVSQIMSSGPIASELFVVSMPTGAQVQLHPVFNNTPTELRNATTDGSFVNLYIGQYAVTVSLPGRKPYTDQLNFLDDLRPRLICSMAPETDPAQSTCTRDK